MWGKVILRAVILLLAVFWLGAVWFSFHGPASISAKVADVVKCVSAIEGKADMAIALQNVRLSRRAHCQTEWAGSQLKLLRRIERYWVK